MGRGEPSNKVCELADTPVRHKTIFGFPMSRNEEIEKEHTKKQYADTDRLKLIHTYGTFLIPNTV